MKKTTTITLLAGLALAATAHAGDTYSAKQEVVQPSSCLWSWFAGGSAGYLTEADEEMYTLHFGTEYRSSSNSTASHSLYLEVGFTNLEDTKNRAIRQGNIVPFETDVDIVPLTINYKYEAALTDKINWYAGLGAGVAFWDGDVKLTRLNGVVDKDSQDDIVYYAHIFAGLVYNVSDSFEVFLGARYIFMDDPDTNVSFGKGAIADAAGNKLLGDAHIDGDVLIELGGRFNF